MLLLLYILYIEAIEIGLYNSLFSVCVIFEDGIVECGRVIGDGGIYFYVQAVIVLLDFRRAGDW